jgi:ATP-dependent Lhr-like helicase
MNVAMQYPSFPIVIETYRACLQDVFDVPALREVLSGIERREIRVHEAETPSASPFARSLVFAYVAAYLYEGDSPAAERRAQTLALDMGLLRELLGDADLRELLDAAVIADVEASLQHTADSRRARDADDIHDMLRAIGDLTAGEVVERCRDDVDVDVALDALAGARRVVNVRVGGRTAWIAVEDAALYRDALGTALPAGVASVFLEPVADPVETLLLRRARTTGPFTTADVATRFGFVPAQAERLLEALADDGRLLKGEFRPGATGPEWCEPDVLRQIKRRAVAKLRGQVAPVSRDVAARFLPVWHGVTRSSRLDRLEDAVARLEGLPLSWRELERHILPARVPGFRPEQLDELGARGWLVWVGHSPLGVRDGRIVLYRRERVGRLLLPAQLEDAGIEGDDRHRAILAHLESRGASFLDDLVNAVGARGDTIDALRDLVWAGLVTNDTFAALRALTSRRKPGASRSAPRRRADRPASATRTVRRSRWTTAAMTGVTPFAAGGRWSLVTQLVPADVSPVEQAHAWAGTLLERHGLLTRESAAIEARRGGFAAIYRVLRAMEDAGKVRRGYFVEGLGGAQFAYSGVIDRLRRVRDESDDDDVVPLSAIDPANPWGWLLPWPEYRDEAARGPRRVAGATVILVAGMPVIFLDRGGRRMRTMRTATRDQIARALAALPDHVRRLPRRTLLVDLIDGHRTTDSDLAPLMRDIGFEREYLSLRLNL